MAKAEKKANKVQAKDLSLEKRIELYNVDFEKFKKETADKYGLALTTEIVYTPQAAVPRLTLYDLLKDANKENKVKQG